MVKGKVASNTTALVQHSGAWWYVKSGKLATGTTTLIQHNGSLWYVVNGKLASATTTLFDYNGARYYIKNGKTQPSLTTLVKYDGVWYYIKNGVVSNRTLFVEYGGQKYFVVDGIAQTTWSGKVTVDGKAYFLNKGILTNCHVSGHRFANNACKSCGVGDPAHAYEYLKAWIEENGDYDDGYYSVAFGTDTEACMLVYNQDEDYVYLYFGAYSNGLYCYATLDLEDFIYVGAIDEYAMIGNLKPSKFTKDTTLTYTDYNGPTEVKETMRDYSKNCVCLLLNFLDDFLDAYGMNLTHKDFGFTAYKN